MNKELWRQSVEGYLRIRNYRVQCTMGVHEHEKRETQEILVDLTVRHDFSEAVQTDSIADTLDYTQMARLLDDVAKQEHFHLIETYAHETLHALFAQFPIGWAKIRVKKKSALPLADYVCVEFEKEV